MLFLEMFWQKKCFSLALFKELVSVCNKCEFLCDGVCYFLLHFGKMVSIDLFLSDFNVYWYFSLFRPLKGRWLA